MGEGAGVGRELKLCVCVLSRRHFPEVDTKIYRLWEVVDAGAWFITLKLTVGNV